jgi:hypothetical protein
MTLHKTTEFYTEWFSVYPNITPKFRTIVIFKNCVKQNNNSNKTCIYVHYLFTKVHLFKCNGSWVFSTKQTMNFNIQLAAMFVFFVSDKNDLTKSCLSIEDLSENKISCFHVGWCKSCIHLRSLNIRHFGMVEGTALKVWRRGHLQWHDLPTKFQKNLPIGSKVIWADTHTDRQTGDLISLTFLFKESRLTKGSHEMLICYK